MGSRHPPVLFTGAPFHPVFRFHPAPVAPPYEGCQHADHLLVFAISAIQVQLGPQAGGTDGGGGLPLPPGGV